MGLGSGHAVFIPADFDHFWKFFKVLSHCRFLIFDTS
jgi:hypothetical protein